MDRTNLFNLIVNSALKVIPGVDLCQISIDSDLSDFGASSLDCMEISSLCMEHLNLDIPMSDFFNISIIRELVNLFLAKLAM